jgi:GNAT superfamily N-acetyltransferase
MVTDDPATRMAESLPAAWEAIARCVDGGVVLRVPDLIVTLTNIPDPELNSAFVERTPRDPSASLEAAAAAFTEHGQRLGIDLPRGWYPDLERAAKELGMRIVESRPGMTAPVSAIAPAVAADDVELLRVEDGSRLEEYREIQTAVFGMAPDIIRAYVGPGALAADDIDLHLAKASGVAVACAAGITVGGTVGVFGVATLPEARRRGIGTAVTAAVIDAARLRADLAWLQASELGAGAYRRMGFRAAADWDVWILPG